MRKAGSEWGGGREVGPGTELCGSVAILDENPLADVMGQRCGEDRACGVFNEKGDILEASERLFKNLVKLYVYPMRMGAYSR